MKRIAAPLPLDSVSELPAVLFDVMSDGVIITAKSGVIVDCNPAFHLHLGYEKSELIGRTLVSLDSPEYTSSVADRLAQIALDGQATFETAHRRKDGGIMPVEIRAHACEVKGEMVFFGIVRDITNRKLVDAQLRQRQEQLSRAEAIAHIGSWELVLLDNRLSWSDEIYCIFEIDPEQFAPSYESFLNAIHPDDRDLVNRTYLDSVESGEAYEVTHRLLMGDGRIKWVNEQGQTYYEKGKAVRSVGTVQDVTAQKWAEDALRNSEAHLRSLIETLPDLVWLKDPEGVYLSCNERFEQFFGAAEAQIIGRTDYDFVDTELADFFREKDRLAIAVGGPSVNEEQITFASDGHSEVLEVIKTPMFNSEGQVVGVLGVGRDITERKHFEADLKEGFDVYQAAINTPAMGFWVVDTTGQLLEVNDAYVQQSGYSRDELLGINISELEASETAAETRGKIAEVMAAGYARFRTFHCRKDGERWPVEVITTYSPIQGGRFFAFLEDLSEKVEQERRLELAASVFDTMNQAVVVTDKDNQIVSINPATTEITGYTLDEIRGKNPRVFASGRHDSHYYEVMWQALHGVGHWEGEIWDRRKDGSVYAKWNSINAIRDAQGKVVQYVSVFSDITERKKTEELIWRQANFDALTGLANRTQFQERLQQELTRRERTGNALAVLYLDLDGFKDVNDSLGHAAGDELLIEVAQRLRACARKTDLVARLGGDEFTLLLTDIKHSEQVASLAEAILESLRLPVKIMAKEIRIGASTGIALCPEDGTSRDELTKHADVAMYQAKSKGKNNFQFFRPEMNTFAVTRLALIHDLHKAVEEQAFELHYQPKIRVADQKLVGMEALIRWPREGEEMVSPDAFIPCAEETGLIIPIGEWVLAEACEQTAEWNRRYDTQLKVAVNLSARQFRSKGLVDEVLDTLQRHELRAELLELEITESILMEDVEEAIQTMVQLREAGVAIAIDDFGTGYSSLSYLKRFPITTLKIDRAFVRDLTEGSQDAAIVLSTIDLARSFGLEVVAEGVESEEQLLFLRKHQCDSAQGYHIARPMPADDFASFLDARPGELI